VTPTSTTFFWEKKIAGRKVRITIGPFPATSPDQARDRAAEIAADYVKGVDVEVAKHKKRDELTFGELWADYRENRARKPHGKPSRTLDYQWSGYLEVWQNKRLSEITLEQARRKILRIRKTAPVQANRVQRQARAMFNHARKELGWKGINPFEFSQQSEKGKARSRRLKPTEMLAFMKGLDAVSESVRLLFLATLYTGRRPGEVKGMRWVDIDLEDGVWLIPDTKAGEPQSCVLPSALVDMLGERLKEADSVFVFPADSESGHVENYTKAWAAVRKASKLRGLQVRDLRRTLASWAQEVQVPMAVVQKQLGHADISVTAQHYTNIIDVVQRASVDTVVQKMIEAAK
jgi:integrase